MFEFTVITFVPMQVTTFSILAFKILKVYCIYHNDNLHAADSKPERIISHKKIKFFLLFLLWKVEKKNTNSGTES